MSPDMASRILLEINKKYHGIEKKIKKSSTDDVNERLTYRQIELLKLLASGKTYKKAGEILGLSERTVKYHMGRIIDILHLDNKAQVIAYAAECGLVDSITKT